MRLGKRAERLAKRVAHLVFMLASNLTLTLKQTLSITLTFNITTLETRRLRGGLIQVFKIFKGLDNVQYSDFFIMADTELRGHELKVYKPQVHLDIRKYFFSVRIVEMHGIVYRLQFYVATLLKI